MKFTAGNASVHASLACAIVLGWSAGTADAVDYFWTAGVGDWATDSNWDQGLTPDAQFEEVGVINNGGTAFVSTAVPDAAGLRMGEAVNEFGQLIVSTGGSITLVDSSGAPTGATNVGVQGTAFLEVQDGGSFTTTLLDSGSNGRVTVGVGSGTATLASTGGMFLGGRTVVNGPAHVFTAAGDVVLEFSSVYAANIAAASHTALSTPGALTLGGELEIDFVDGFGGAVGQAWTLFDVGSVVGDTADIELSLTPVTGPGERFRVAVNPGGVNGQQVQAIYESAVVLAVDATSGAVSFSSPSGNTHDIVGYTLGSPSGVLVPASWNGLEDQSVAGWDEANPTANNLTELFSAAGSGLTVGVAEVSLGSPYVAPTEFGVAPDLTFEYVNAANEVVEGIIDYVGSRGANNLLLTVDPNSGDASLTNSSNFTIDLAGYSVLSGEGMLDVSGWSSLDDQNVDAWEEANPTANALTELLSGAAASIAPGQSFSLGSLFNPAIGGRDLVLEFVLDGELAARQGVVEYGTIAASLVGDFNGDGFVNAADYTVYRDTLNSTSDLRADADGDGRVDPDDLALWAGNYGATNAAPPAVAVPEPSVAALLTLAVAAGSHASRRRVGAAPSPSR